MLKKTMGHIMLLGMMTITACESWAGEGFVASPATSYRQTITITGADAEALNNATVSIAPLYEDYERAVSCRWDDNQPNGLKMKELMDARGIKGTWYLNAPGVNYHNSDEDFLPVARKLLANDNSIGCHTLSHPYITYVNRNRMFEELAGLRVLYESALDTHINSHAFSFVNYRNMAEGDVVQTDLIASLKRAGLYHVTTFLNFRDFVPCDLLQSVIMPPENAPFEDFKKAVDWAVSEPYLKENFPLISHSMHAWYGTEVLEYGWDEAARRLDYLNQFDFWQCNQNQFAAYWRQYKEGRIVETKLEGDKLLVVVERPTLIELNDPIALTICVDGVDSGRIKNIDWNEGSLEQSTRSSKNHLLFNLPHASSQLFATKIAHIANQHNDFKASNTTDDEDFAAFSGSLSFDKERLFIELDVQGDTAIENLHRKLLTPIGYEDLGYVIYPNEGKRNPLSSISETYSISKLTEDLKYHSDLTYFVAQLDFRHEGFDKRLYLSCHVDNREVASFPRDNFAVMGPIPRQAFDADKMTQWLRDHRSIGDQYDLGDGQSYRWRINRNGPIVQHYLDPEVIRTGGDWFVNYSDVYFLRSQLSLPETKQVKFDCNPEDVRAIFIDGKEVEDFTATIDAGEHTLDLIYYMEFISGTERNVACFLRMTDALTNERLQDLSYAMPAMN